MKSAGSSNYQGIVVQNTFADATNKGAVSVMGARYTNANLPFTVLANWDDTSSRQINIGGGGWNAPDANSIALYTAPAYSEVSNTGVARLSINSAGTVAVSGTLTVGSTASITGTTTTTQLIVNTPHNTNGIVIGNSSLTSKSWIFYPYTNGSNTDMRFYETGAGDRMTFQSGGNVGIRITKPESKNRKFKGIKTMRTLQMEYRPLSFLVRFLNLTILHPFEFQVLQICS